MAIKLIIRPSIETDMNREIKFATVKSRTDHYRNNPRPADEIEIMRDAARIRKIYD